MQLLIRTTLAAGLLALVSFSLSVLAVTPTQERAIKASEALQEEGKFDQAVQVLAAYASSDDPEMEYALAYAHMNNGTIGKKDGEADTAEIKLAVEFAERAIAHGNTAGLNLLYMIYGNGYGIPVDATKAADYLRRGAEAGESSALLNYAISLYEGSDVIDRDVDRACPLIKQALEDERIQALIAHQAGLVQIRGQCCTQG